ncbi:MAG: hypothetical protein ACLQIB_28990 [Isosphaeraceae bacterium]
MNRGLRPETVLVAGVLVAAALGSWAHCRAGDFDTTDKLTLADLAAYRAALSGQPTADRAQATDPPRQVRFRDLWNQPDAFRGRRVIVQGRVERIFRQAAVGSFPPLAEAWIASPAGDPFCVVFAPRETTAEEDEPDGTKPRERAPPTPGLGRTVRFTGTFLKMVTYAAPDGKRLAPLVVGERPPLYKPDSNKGDDAAWLREDAAEVLGTIGGRNSQPRHDQGPPLPASWALALTLAALVAGIITWQHLRPPVRRRRSCRQGQGLPGDDEPPLEFINSHDDP